ncbi:unnamed protein product [Amoebophrya sp. A120]|nr:unnamed protein product [Amoebophrya sp. A120]|eukprot:GSA120T00010262001.1
MLSRARVGAQQVLKRQHGQQQAALFWKNASGNANQRGFLNSPFYSQSKAFATATAESAGGEGAKQHTTGSFLRSPQFIAGFIGANCLLQYQFGSTNSTIIDDRFTCGKDPDALAEFYEAHDLLEVMMPVPMLFKFVMDQVTWDGVPPSDEKPALLTMDESRCYVGLVGMDVGFEITREEDEDDKLCNFVRYERFIHNIPFLADYYKIPVCESTWKFGFRKLTSEEKGLKGKKCHAPMDEPEYEVFHQCVGYGGFWLFRCLMYVHHCYIIWGCDKICNNWCFAPGEDEAAEEEHRRQVACVPLYEIKRVLGMNPPPSAPAEE